MSKIIPLPALLPPPELAQAIAAPPYDVVTADEAHAFASGNPLSFFHLTRAEIDLLPGAASDGDRTFAKAAENFCRFREAGWLAPAAPAFLHYRIEWQGRAQTGLVCGASTDEYESGAIKRHERTREAKVTERARLALAVGAHLEPVLLVCRASAAITAAFAPPATPPLFDISLPDGSRHLLWRAKNGTRIEEAFASLDALYIADGHHRSEVASRVRRELRGAAPSDDRAIAAGFFPAVIFPHDEVRIYHYDWDGPAKERPLADVTIEDVMRLADENGIMPPKSTWFAPKLASGLFVYPLE